MKLALTPRMLMIASAAIVLVAFLVGYSSPGAVAEREREARLRGLPEVGAGIPDVTGLEVVSLEVRRQEIRLDAELSATLEPIRRVSLAAEVDGRVSAVPGERHSSVEEGAMLVELERDFYQAALDRAKGALLRANANKQLAKAELERQRGLAERKVASARDLDRAEADQKVRSGEALEAKASLDDANTRIAKTEIRAPFAGVVNQLDLEPGAYLRAGDVVAEVFDLSAIEVEVGVTEQQVVALAVGDAVVLEVDVFPSEVFEGSITRLGRGVDAETKKYPVEVRVPNPEERLLPGMIGSIRFDLGARDPAIRIPRRATQKEFELVYVFVLEPSAGAGATVRHRRVETRAVPFRPELIEILGGLEDGEKIAVSGMRELHDGLSVRIKEPGA